MQSRLKSCAMCFALMAMPLAALADETTFTELLLDSPRATVSSQDIEYYIQENLPRDEEERASILNRPGIYKEMVETLYIVRALAAEAESVPGFDEELARWSANMAYQRKLINDYKRTYIAGLFRDVNWDVAALEHYNASPEQYMSQEKVSASHILIKTEERSQQQALQLAEDLYARIANNEDFTELAKEFSEDGSASKGGSLGYFQRGKMVKPFEEAAFDLKNIGDVTQPVKSPFGYHLIRLDDRKPQGMIPFGEVKPRIIKSLRSAKGDQAWQDKVIRLRSAQDIVINEEALQALEASR